MYVVLERDLPLTPPPDAPPQAIVVLGGDISRSGSDRLVLQPGALSLQRERTGADLYRHTHLPILISGGSLHEGKSPIATMMADSMVHDFQVPVRWEETVSRDTWENAHQCRHPSRARHSFRLSGDAGLAHAAGNPGVRGYRDHGDRRTDAYRSHAVIAGSISYPSRVAGSPAIMRFMSLSVGPIMRCADLLSVTRSMRCLLRRRVVRRHMTTVCEPCMVPGGACRRNAERGGRAIPVQPKRCGIPDADRGRLGPVLGSLTTLYRCRYRPLVAAAVADASRNSLRRAAPTR